jgi:putative endonuclease
MISCYILHSEKLDRFYIGATQDDLDERIKKHNSHFYNGQHFTKQASDWVLFLAITCSSFSQARAIENHIKRMKSKKYIDNLKRYPEIVEKLTLATNKVV